MSLGFVFTLILGLSGLAGFILLHRVQDYLRGGQKFSQLDPQRKQMVVFVLIGEWPSLFLTLYCAQQVMLITTR
jgi:hypothetical protein